MRHTTLLAVSSIALLIGCSEQQSLPSALTPGRPSFVTYTASTGAPVVLGGWNSSSYTIAYDINDAGIITGVSDASITAVGWATGTNAAPKSTTPFRISTSGGIGRAINSAGQVAGENGSGAGLWTPVPKSNTYTLTDIGADPLFAGATTSAAYGINASGQVVGSYTVAGVTNCFLWTPSSPNGTTGSAAQISGLNGSSFCVANDINSSGQIAGASNTGVGTPNHAFVRSGGTTIDLQPSGFESYGAAINNLGQVAGSHLSPTASSSSAAIWTPSGGVWSSAVDLGTPRLSGQTGTTITSAALDINDAGYVVGYTHDVENNVDRAFFWQGTAFTELTDSGPSLVEATGLTQVMANRVIVSGSDLDSQGVRRGLRWVISLKR